MVRRLNERFAVDRERLLLLHPWVLHLVGGAVAQQKNARLEAGVWMSFVAKPALSRFGLRLRLS